MEHQYQMGLLSYGIDYFSEYAANRADGMSDYDAYMVIPDEIQAYKSQELITDFFNNADNLNEFNTIFNDENLSQETKSLKLEVLGLEKVAIPAKMKQIEYFQKLSSTATNEKDKVNGAFMVDALTKDINNLNQKLSEKREVLKKAESNDLIIKKLGAIDFFLVSDQNFDTVSVKYACCDW